MSWRAAEITGTILERPFARFLSICFLLGAITLILWMRLFDGPTVIAAPRVAWPTISLQPVTGGLTQPTSITHAGDNSGRIFMTERAGKIRIYKNGSLQSTPFLDIGPTGANRVQSSGSEQGLLSVTFPPNYAAKGYFYINYTSRLYGAVGDTVIARYRLTANPDVADPNSEQVILAISQPEANHNGGQLQFGPDGFLYIGMGDGGGGGDQHGTIGNAQDPSTLLGKMLRINVEPISNPSPPPTPSFTPVFTFYLPLIVASANPPVTYTIPLTNPFISTSGYRPEIWALGLRNPWRFSFDRQTRDLYIADVGQNAWEEVDFQPATNTLGLNYGWRCYEGNHIYDFTNNPDCSTTGNYVFPVTEYDHASNGGPCSSITGGYVYRGSTYPAMQGVYFYGDYCSGKFWGLQKDGSNWVTNQFTTPLTSFSFSTFGEDQVGELYAAFYNAGIIYKITSP